MNPLRIYRELDTNKLSPLTREFLLAFEGQSDFVDNDTPRDDVFTEEVIEATIAYHIVSDDGQSLAKFDSLAKAEKAAAGAKVTFNVDIEVPKEEEPAKPAKV